MKAKRPGNGRFAQCLNCSHAKARHPWQGIGLTPMYKCLHHLCFAAWTAKPCAVNKQQCNHMQLISNAKATRPQDKFQFRLQAAARFCSWFFRRGANPLPYAVHVFDCAAKCVQAPCPLNCRNGFCFFSAGPARCTALAHRPAAFSASLPWAHCTGVAVFAAGSIGHTGVSTGAAHAH